MSSETKPQEIFYGGQAVIEGVMMRGAHKAAIAVRDPNGEIHVREEALNATLYRGWVRRTPFVRGLIGLWDALGLGTRALLWSADIALIEGSYYRVRYQDEAGKDQAGWLLHSPSQVRLDGDLNTVPALKKATTEDIPTETGVFLSIETKKGMKILEKPEPKAKTFSEIPQGARIMVTGFKAEAKEGDVFTGAAATGMLVVSLALGMGLFFLLPAALSSGIGELIGTKDGALTNVIEEAVKMTLFLGYIILIAQIPDVKRLFQYHGAEHKTINAYEANVPLTPAEVQKQSIEHPRCGTAFLLNVIIISIIVNSIIGRFDNNLLLLVPARLATIPIVAGIAYEWLRWTAKNSANPIVAQLIKPNLLLQKLTTNPPDDEMVEVAIAAFERVLVAEQEAAETIPSLSANQPAEA